MQKVDGGYLYSATDLGWHALCPHRTRLRVAELGGLFRPVANKPNPSLDLAVRYGRQYEQDVLGRIRRDGGSTQIAVVGSGLQSPAELRRASVETARLLSERRPYIYQGVLIEGRLVCIPDFMELAHDGVYEVWDVKWSRSVKRDAEVQVIAGAAALGSTLGCRETRARLMLGDGSEVEIDFADGVVALDSARQGLERVLGSKPLLPNPVWGTARSEDCAKCRFRDNCAKGREQDRDLSLVLGMHPRARAKLIDGGTRTIDALAVAGDDSRPPDLRAAQFETLRAQARIQVEGEAGTAWRMVNGLGVDMFDSAAMAARLPAPDPHDVFFDTEGFSYAEGGEGIEYLFGWIEMETGEGTYHHLWGDARAEEKTNYADFVDRMYRRWKAHPRMHVHHFHHHELTVLGQMADRFGIRQQELDDLKSGGVFIDLLTVVKAGMRTSARSLGLKSLERLYQEDRHGTVGTAVDSMAEYQRYLDVVNYPSRATEALTIRTGITDYNEADCRSTKGLRDWLVSALGDTHEATARGRGTVSPAVHNVREAGRAQPPVMTCEFPDPGLDQPAATRGPVLEWPDSTGDSLAMPAKLVDCRTHDSERAELFVLGGSSALGTVKLARDSQFQALLPIRGNLLNAQRASNADMLRNVECATIITSIGAWSGCMFDLNAVRYGKIILMADADVDGAQFRTLLLTLFHRYMPELLTSGRVYMAVPPLHLIEILNSFGRVGEVRYTHSDEQTKSTLADLTRRHLRWKEPIHRYRAFGEMGVEQLRATTMEPGRRTLHRVRMADAEHASWVFDLLMGADVASRREYLVDSGSHVAAQDLDY